MNFGNGLERGIIILSNSSMRYVMHYTASTIDADADGVGMGG